jgi:hypothetical protein
MIVEPAGATEDELLIVGIGILCNEEAVFPELSVTSTVFEDGASESDGIRKVPDALPVALEIPVATR